MKLTPTINLLKKKDRDFFEEFIKWALTIGRLIIILTELIALSAFLYRFTLDRKLIDLHEKIKQKQVVLDLFKENEEKYREIQKKLAEANRLSWNSEKTNKIYKDISSFASEVSLLSFSITEKDVKIEITTSTLSNLVSFIKELKEYEEIKSVSLDSIKNKTSLGIITATITANRKNQENEKESF